MDGKNPRCPGKIHPRKKRHAYVQYSIQISKRLTHRTTGCSDDSRVKKEKKNKRRRSKKEKTRRHTHFRFNKPAVEQNRRSPSGNIAKRETKWRFGKGCVCVTYLWPPRKKEKNCRYDIIKLDWLGNGYIILLDSTILAFLFHTGGGRFTMLSVVRGNGRPVR